MEGTLFSIWKGATKDGPGIRTVVALKGCPLAPVLDNMRHLSVAKRRILMRCPMIPGINDDDAEIKARGVLADELDAVESIDVLPYVPYGIDKAHRLGLKVYEAPQPPPTYGPAIVARLSRLTRKPVRLP